MTVRAFAHRGGATHPDLIGLENTLLAFRHAVDLGYVDLETDVHVSRDGVLIAFHDSVLDRVTNSSGSIADHTADELTSALIGGTEPVPTLAQLFDAVPDDVRINIDLKAPGTAEPLAHFIAERGLADRIMVGSFSIRELHRFRAITKGSVATSAHPGEIVAYLAAPHAKLLSRLAPKALQIPHYRNGIQLASRRIIDRAQSFGAEVHVWTIDNVDEMHLLLDRGVDGLMTDRTDLLKQVLVERGLWEGK